MPKKMEEREGGVVELVLATPKASSPVLVCGLPGSGYVGKLAADHLVSTFKAKKVAEYTCDSFPPQVSVRVDGTAGPLKAELFFARGRRGQDLFVFTADAQPTASEGEYELADAVIRYAKKQGVKKVFSLAAYITGAFSAEPKVYGAATSHEMLKVLAGEGATLMKDGGISGVNGLMVGIAFLRGLEGACLLGETSGYFVDAGASKAVLEVLARLICVPIDTSKLKDKAEETQKAINQLQSMAEQSQEGVPPSRETRPAYIA
jgi:hypothetical protein